MEVLFRKFTPLTGLSRWIKNPCPCGLPSLSVSPGGKKIACVRNAIRKRKTNLSACAIDTHDRCVWKKNWECAQRHRHTIDTHTIGDVCSSGMPLFFFLSMVYVQMALRTRSIFLNYFFIHTIVDISSSGLPLLGTHVVPHAPSRSMVGPHLCQICTRAQSILQPTLLRKHLADDSTWSLIAHSGRKRK